MTIDEIVKEFRTAAWDGDDWIFYMEDMDWFENFLRTTLTARDAALKEKILRLKKRNNSLAKMLLTGSLRNEWNAALEAAAQLLAADAA